MARSAKPGQRIAGRFELIREIGSGGFGTVWLAKDHRFGDDVAIKLLHSEFQIDRRVTERFEREGKVLTTLEHPAINRALGFGASTDASYIALEYLTGITLRSKIGQHAQSLEPIPLPEILRIVDTLAEGLDYAHAKGVIHRDLKPSNVMLCGRDHRTVKILDFGAAKLVRGDAHDATTKGRVLGSILYLSPEQLTSGEQDARTDVYALAIVAWEALTLKRLFARNLEDQPLIALDRPVRMAAKNGHVEIVRRILREARFPASRFRPGLDERVDAVLTRALSVAPEARFDSAGALAAALRGAMGEEKLDSIIPFGTVTGTAYSVPDADDTAEEDFGGGTVTDGSRTSFAQPDQTDEDPPARPESVAPRPQTNPDPDTIGRYRIERRLGEGGMSTVYAAVDARTGYRVALKVLRDDGLSEVVVRRRQLRMQREAEALIKIAHPNVVKIYEIGAYEARTFIAMELIDGAHLAAWLRERRRSWLSILRVFVEAGRGLAAAHRASIMHRDFKPANVMVASTGRVLVTDFGLARLEESSDDGGALAQPLTRGGAVLGTPRYMAPEQHQGLSADSKADQFAFSVALYEALYGRLPFKEERSDSLTAEVAYALEVVAGRVQPPPSPSEVPAEIGALLLRGLAKEPEARHASMDALLELLEPFSRPPRRSPAAWIAAGLLFFASTMGVIALAVQQRPQPTTPPACQQRSSDLIAPVHPGLAAAARSFDISWRAARDRACEPGADPKVVACLQVLRSDVARWIAGPLRSAPPLASIAALRTVQPEPCEPPGAAPVGLDAAVRQIETTTALEAWTFLLGSLQLGRSPTLVYESVPRTQIAARRVEALGLALSAYGERDAAIQYLSAAATAFSTLGLPDEQLRASFALARETFAAGDVSAASAQLGRAIEIERRLHGSESAGLVRLYLSRAVAEAELGRYEEATAELDRARLIIENGVGADSVEFGDWRVRRAYVATRARDFEKAIAELDSAIVLLSARNEALAARARHDRAWNRWALGRRADALQDAIDAAITRRRTLGPSDPSTVESILAAAFFEVDLAQLAAARARLEPLIAIEGLRPDQRSQAEYLMARTRGRDASRDRGARALAESALARLDPNETQLRDAIRSWLDGGPPRRPPRRVASPRKPARVVRTPSRARVPEVEPSPKAPKEDDPGTLKSIDRTVLERPGKLRVVVRTGGRAAPFEVLVDGRRVGQSPLVLDLPAGAHEVEVRGPAGQVSKRTIQVGADKTKRAIFDL